jgi:RNA-directed DNA polymerase
MFARPTTRKATFFRVAKNRDAPGNAAEESFDFLGDTLGRCYRVKTGQAYIGTKPSKKRVLKLCESISQKTQREANGRDTEEMIGELNLMLKGWANYFRLGSLSKAYESGG